MKHVVVMAWLGAVGCTPAHLIGQRAPRDALSVAPARTVVVEPLFDRAEWKTSTRTEFITVPGNAGFGTGIGMTPAGGPTTVAINRTVTELPLFARPKTLAEIHQRLVPAIAALRPTWTVVSPAAAPTLKGLATVVRTVIDGNELVQSDRPLKNAAFAFGLLLWPLQFIAARPVEETQRVGGLLERVALDPPGLQQRLVKYATQPDYAVNFSGLSQQRQPFALDVEYEEGLFADETPRTSVLIDGFVEKLAFAIVTFVEEGPVP
jgi:hypothetical protein